MKFTDWIGALTEQQVRALASQAKVHGAITGKIDKLRNRVAESDSAKAIFEENYGKEASVQNAA